MKKLNYKIRINTYKNAIFQIFSIGISFYLYPLLIKVLDDRSLGVWLTLLSIAGWFLLFDIGIANGLRNKLSKLLVKNKVKLIKAYLSSTYFFFTIFLFFLILIISIVLINFNTSIIFNIEPNTIENLNLSVFLVFITILLNLLFTINFSLSNALQEASFVNFRNLLFNISFMVCLLSFSLALSQISLLIISILFFFSNMIANLYTTIILYKKNNIFIPTYKLISFKLFKNNLKIGISFFIINISSVIMFSTDNILISQLLGVKYVVQYSLTIKIFMIFLLLLWFYTSSLWSAYTEMYYKKDFAWIKKTLIKSLLISFFIIILLILVGMQFNLILELWTSKSYYYNKELVLGIEIIIILRIWNGNFSTLLNGLGYTKIQRNTAVFSTVLNIPLSIILVKYTTLGIVGIAYGTAVSLSIFSIIAPIYTYKILKKEMLNAK